jgi:hypothetical protein
LLATPNTMPVLPVSMGHRLPQRALYSVTMTPSLGLAPSLEPPHREFHEVMAVLRPARP